MAKPRFATAVTKEMENFVQELHRSINRQHLLEGGSGAIFTDRHQAIAPYVAPKVRAQKCDYCGRPLEGASQCAGCGAWRKDLR